MKVISAIVGLVLLGASFTLAYLSNNNANEMIANKDAIVMKYIEQSNEAIAADDFKAATKFAKLAIAADPKSKKAFKAYEDIMEAKYQPNTTGYSNLPVSGSSMPVQEEEEEDDMGC